MSGHTKLHGIGDGVNHTSGTLAELNSLIDDATLVSQVYVDNADGLNSSDIDYLSGRVDYYSDHANLSGLNWSESNHVIDTTINFQNNGFSGVGYADFSLNMPVVAKEGRLQWDADNGTLTFGLPGGDVHLQIGQEQLVRAKADQNISNGELVYITGASGSNPTADVATCSGIMADKVIAMATEDIASSQFGYFTTVGAVNDIPVPTATFSEGDIIYLGETPGTFTITKPVYPCTAIKVGYVLRAHDTVGKVLISINSEEWRRLQGAQKEPTGFPIRYPDLIGDMSFDNGTRTFTIAPKSGQEWFSYFVDGNEYRHETADSVTIDNTEGTWFIYYNEDVLYSSQTPWSFDDGDVFVAIIYWDADNSRYALGEERHGISMDQATHEYLHNTVGAAYNSGFTPSLTVDANGSLSGHCEMQSISLGTFYDEDILLNNTEQTTYELWWKEGATNWRWQDASPALVSMGATYPYWNEFTGGVWQRTECSNNSYVLAHIFATNRYGSTDKVIIVMGENNYNSKADAQDGALTEILNITTTDLPTPEFVEIASVIIEVKSVYTNAYNAIVVSTDEGGDFIDFRTNEKIGVGATATDHGNLTGLGDNDHPQYTLVTDTASISGSLQTQINENSTSITSDISQATHGLSVGNPIYFNGTSWVKAQADSSNTLGTAIVSEVTDANNFTLIYSGEITGLSGLTAGTYYFVSESLSGELTSTEPLTYSNPILQATATTSGIVLPWRAQGGDEDDTIVFAEKDATASDQTYSLPAITADNDGKVYSVYKFGAYKLTVQPNGTDKVGDSGEGYGVETLDAGNAAITLIADNSTSTWHVVNNVGRWAVEGAKFSWRMDRQYLYNLSDAGTAKANDSVTGLDAYVHFCPVVSGTPFSNRGSVSIYEFDGSSEYVRFNDSTAFDVCGSLTDDWTVSVLVKPDRATLSSAQEYFFVHNEDVNNFWSLERNAIEQIRILARNTGGVFADIKSSATITDTDWHQIDVVKVGSGLGLYIDSAHAGSDTITAADTYNGSFYLGQSGSSLYFFGGKMADLFIVNQNLYSVDPTDSGSTVPVRTDYAKLIYN